jgi:putative transposase
MVRRYKQTTDSDHELPTTDSDHELPVFPNLCSNVIPTGPDEVWAGDPTHIRSVFGFAYLAALLDACSRKVVGYAI